MTTKLSADDFRRQGFGKSLRLRAPFGLLLVDFVNGFANPAILGGGNIAESIARSRTLLAQARLFGWPVAHSRIVYADDGADANVFSEKVPSLLSLTEQAETSQIVTELAPRDGEYVVRKSAPSAFFGTALAPWYANRGVATLVIAGCVTSGCVRASVVDAMCHGFRPVVVQDCVGDRSLPAHDASLFDMRQKYAEVMPLDGLMTMIVAEDD